MVLHGTLYVAIAWARKFLLCFERFHNAAKIAECAIALTKDGVSHLDSFAVERLV